MTEREASSTLQYDVENRERTLNERESQVENLQCYVVRRELAPDHAEPIIRTLKEATTYGVTFISVHNDLEDSTVIGS